MTRGVAKSDGYERELREILQARGLGYVVRAGGSRGVDLVLILRGWKGETHECVPIEIKATEEDVLYLSRSKALRKQYEAYEEWREKTGLRVTYAIRKKRAPAGDQWRVFPWPERPGPGSLPVLAWNDGLKLAEWLNEYEPWSV